MSSITIKLFLNDEVRRVTVGADVFADFDALNAKVKSIVGSALPPVYSLRWKDADGDLNVLSNDQDLQEALAASAGILRVYVSAPLQTLPAAPTASSSAKPTASTEPPRQRHCPYTRPPPPADHGSAPQKHVGVVCDGCGGGIEGSRFKCTRCPDFDLCPSCESKGLHATHEMLRIRTPRARFVRPSGCTRDPTPAELFQNLSQWIPVVTQAIPVVAEAVGRCADQCARAQRCNPAACHVPPMYQQDFDPEAFYEAPPQQTPSHDATPQDVPDHVRYQEQLASLAEMGFVDTDEVLPLLRAHQGHVPRVVADLFARRS